MNQLKEKMQELNMYRSLLLQQISTIKLLCTNKEDNQVIYKKMLRKIKSSRLLEIRGRMHRSTSDAHKNWHVALNKSELIKYTKTDANNESKCFIK